MKNRIIKGTLCGLIILLMTPGLVSFFVKHEFFAINENRNKLAFPTREEIRSDGFVAINSWFNDNYGLRDLLIRCQHQIDYSIFGYSKELFTTHIDGKEYLHYRSVIAVEQVQNEQMAEEVQSSILAQYIRVADYLEKRNIAFRFIVPPQKNEILDVSDQIPVIRAEPNMYFKMQERFIDSELSDNYVVITDALIRENKKAPVFFQTDFHWDGWGAAVAFGQVINSLEDQMGIESHYDVSKLEIDEFKPDGNFGQLSSLSVLFYDIPNETRVSMPGIDVVEELQDKRYPKYHIWKTDNPIEFNQGIMIIGDSYTEYLIGSGSGILELFPKVYFCHWNDSAGVMTNIPDDVGIVVMERIESAYPQMPENIQGLW